MGISTSTINSPYKINNNPLIKKSIFLLLQKSTTKILLVEGDGDVPFYSKYINSSVTISEITKTKTTSTLAQKQFLNLGSDKHCV